MSNIPLARGILREALYGDADPRACIERALTYLDRKKPAFIAPRRKHKLSPFNVSYARQLRSTGMGLEDIARTLKTNIGRVSEACA